MATRPRKSRSSRGKRRRSGATSDARTWEQQVIDYMLFDAPTHDAGTFSRASTEDIAKHFDISPEVAYKRLNPLARRGILEKSRDELMGAGRRGRPGFKKAVGWQLWEYLWKPADDERYERGRRGRPGYPLQEAMHEALVRHQGRRA